MTQTIALAVALALFYGSYLWTWWAQRTRGVEALRLGLHTSGTALWVERFVLAASVAALAGQVASFAVSAPVTWGALAWVGVVLAFAGVGCFVAAQSALGPAWGAGVPAAGADAKLVTSGVYRWSRNPAFLGFWLLYAGTVVVLPSWWMLLLAVLAADGLYLQVRLVEEPHLLAAYGKPYEAYCRDTARWLGRGWGWRRGLWRAFDVLLALAIGVALLLAVYSSDYYRAGEKAQAALAGTAQVTVTQTEDELVFAPADPVAGLVFYPGAKVAPEAYAPLLEALAQKGFLCVEPKMPLNLAVMNPSAASTVQERFPQVTRWYLAGHSLGGSMVAAYLAGQLGRWDGLALLGSYSTEDLSQVVTSDGGSLAVVSIYGSEDQVVNREMLQEGEARLPADAQTVVIEGGNHAQFGDYGEQAGDGEASVSAEQQVEQTADAIADAFGVAGP